MKKDKLASETAWGRKQIYNRIFTEQNGCCKICGIHQSQLSKKLSLDHCHETEALRGLLCTNCNLGLGNFQDDINLLLKAAIYLREARGIRIDDVERCL